MGVALSPQPPPPPIAPPTQSSSSNDIMHLMTDHQEHDLERKLSFSDQDDILPPIALLNQQRSFVINDDIDEAALLLELKRLRGQGNGNGVEGEEGILLGDLELVPENLLTDYEMDYLENITSCNKVENCVILSEFEQNLIKETEENSSDSIGNSSSSSSSVGPLGVKKKKKWSLFVKPDVNEDNGEKAESGSVLPEFSNVGARRKGTRLNQLLKKSSQSPKRSITVIEENSV